MATAGCLERLRRQSSCVPWLFDLPCREKKKATGQRCDRWPEQALVARCIRQKTTGWAHLWPERLLYEKKGMTTGSQMCSQNAADGSRSNIRFALAFCEHLLTIEFRTRRQSSTSSMASSSTSYHRKRWTWPVPGLSCMSRTLTHTSLAPVPPVRA